MRGALLWHLSGEGVSDALSGDCSVTSSLIRGAGCALLRGEGVGCVGLGVGCVRRGGEESRL